MSSIISCADKQDSLGNKLVTLAPSEGSVKTFVTPNMCNRASWWFDANVVEDEILTSVNGLDFHSQHGNWINPFEITDSDQIPADRVPEIKVDGVTVNAFKDYTNGVVSFESDHTGRVVTANYAYGGSPLWEVVPCEGRVLRVVMSELQISRDVQITSDILFEVLIHTAEDAWTVVSQNRYKNAKDLIGRSNKGYVVPAFGELLQDVVVLPFEYPAVIDLRYAVDGLVSPAMKIRIRLDGNFPMGGEYGCATLYCLSEIQY